MPQVDGYSVRAPGRVCLFGEHSDYLGLDAVAAAIDLVVKMSVRPREDNVVHVSLKDTGESITLDLSDLGPYQHARDYVRAAFRVLQKHGFSMRGADIEVSGAVPMGAGLSSSSALTVAAILAGCSLAGVRPAPSQLVEMAYQAEVVEFDESGGLMDHSASVYGGLVHIEPVSPLRVTRLPAIVDGLVIGDCGIKKQDTVGDLRRIRRSVERGYAALTEALGEFEPRSTPLHDVLSVADTIPERYRRITITTLRNRDLTARAVAYLRLPHPSPETLGTMIDEHHRLLRDGFGTSIEPIEALIEAAKNAGALGCKINGSGRGGTMLAYAPGRENEVMGAIREMGGSPQLVRVSGGASVNLMSI